MFGFDFESYSDDHVNSVVIDFTGYMPVPLGLNYCKFYNSCLLLKFGVVEDFLMWWFMVVTSTS